MSAATAPNAPLGFLTVVENPELGLLGGYLLLNAAGRPLEFHCTAPVKPNRAQEILYGPTLRPFLYGEQIGQTLLTRSKLKPLVVCTDSEPVLAAREAVELPIVLVLGERSEVRVQRSEEEVSIQPQPPPTTCYQHSAFTLASSRVWLPAAHAADETLIRQRWPAQADALDLWEPFARIREALEEAQRTARAA